MGLRWLPTPQPSSCFPSCSSSPAPQAHLQHNALLHDVFGFQPRAERPDRLTALEKRLTRGSQSAGAKARSANRTWSRDAKASRMMMEAY